MAEIRRLAEEAEPTAWIPGAAPWVHEAGRPYVDWLLGGHAPARDATARWMRRTGSELYIGRATVLVEGGEQLGGYIALPGSELHRARQSDSVAAAGEVPDRGALLQRFRAAADLFAEVSPEQLYLSRIAVDAGRQRLGLGRRLLEDYLSTGERLGFKRFRLDVSADNRGAIELYRSMGFEAVHEGSTADGAITYLGMALQPSA